MHPGTFAERTPDKAAVVMADGRRLSYEELEQASNRLAHLFRASGLRRGDHVALVMENRPELLVAFWAAQRAGLYYTPCSTLLNEDELRYIVDDCGARVLLATPKTLGAVERLDVPAVERRLLVGASGDASRDASPGAAVRVWEPLDEALAPHPATPIADEAEGDAMLYSSGTTGRPKGVKSPLPDVPYPSIGMADDFAELFGLSNETVFLVPAPLYHAAPLFMALIVHRLGGTIVLQERFDAEDFLRLIEAHRVTFTQVVPTMFVRLLALPPATRQRYDLSSLAGAVHTAAPCPIPVKEEMIRWWGPVIHEYYTGTEGSGFVHCTSEEWLAHKGTVGRSLAGPLHILDDDGNELPPGQQGVIYFDNAGFEYHGDPERTAASRDPRDRGWSTLGDIGYVDEDGFLYLTDRKAHTIISGGVNIYPREAEDVLIVHPAVADVAVFGIPHETMGEQVHAVVQPARGVEPSDELGAQLIAYCRERLAHYKCPRSVEFRTGLPRHPNGKLYKRLLRDEYWRGRSLTT
ncbi:MAG TPA: AMP-binding protein [Acidimicrobiales bacterium]